MTKEEIFDYVMESPDNTNPAVLRSMLNELSGGTSNWQETNLVTVDNLEWTKGGKGDYCAVIEQEIDIELRDFIICTIGDELEQYQDVYTDDGTGALRLVYYSDAEKEVYVHYQPQNHVIEIMFLSRSGATPTANTFILNKLTKASATILDPEPDPLEPDPYVPESAQ